MSGDGGGLTAESAARGESELGLEVDLGRGGDGRNAQALAGSYASGADGGQDYQRLIVGGRLRNALHQLKAAQRAGNTP